MTTTTTKLQVGAAAFAMAAAAVITPVVAQADSMAPMTPSLTGFSQGLGNTVVSPIKPGNAAARASATATIFKNNILWLGNAVLPAPTQNDAYWNDPGTTRTSTQNFTPLWVRLGKQIFPNLQYWTTWDAGSSQTCFLGFTSALGGPYSAAGTISQGYNRKGCTPS